MVASGESDTSLLMVTDIMTEVTELLWAGKNGDVLEKAFGNPEADGHFHMPGVLSRKKQIVPPLTENKKCTRGCEKMRISFSSWPLFFRT